MLLSSRIVLFYSAWQKSHKYNIYWGIAFFLLSLLPSARQWGFYSIFSQKNCGSGQSPACKFLFIYFFLITFTLHRQILPPLPSWGRRGKGGLGGWRSWVGSWWAEEKNNNSWHFVTKSVHCLCSHFVHTMLINYFLLF